MSQAANPSPPAAGESLWRAGTLSVDDLERLAGSIRPSWEIGLDAVSDDAAPAVTSAPITPSAEGFSAAPSRVVADLGAMGATPASTAPTAATLLAKSPVAAPMLGPTDAKTATPAESTERLPSVRPQAAAPRPSARPATNDSATSARVSRPPLVARAAPAGIDDAIVLPKRGGNRTVVFAVGIGALVVALGAFFALRPSEGAAPAASMPENVSASHEAASPTTSPPPTPVAAPVAAHEEPATPPPAVVAPAPQRPAPPPAAPVRVAAADRPAPAPAATHEHSHSSGSTHHHAATHASSGSHRGHGGTFVTDSPY